MERALKKYNIAIVGVGGQGLLTLGAIIGEACSRVGLDVAVAEVHGMSQRGGSVIVHVRIGNEPSPIIPLGGADHIISLELLEATRYLPYANRDTVISINDFLWSPPLSNYPNRASLIKAIGGRVQRVYLVNANEISTRIIGSPISANIAILGFSLGVDERLSDVITVDHVEEALGEMFHGKALEYNKQILRIGYEEGLRNAER